MSSPEQYTGGAEHGVEAKDAAAERSKELLDNNVERAPESPEKKAERVETARTEAKEALLSKERGGAEKKRHRADASPATHATKRQRHHSYLNTMEQIRSEMNGPSRTFSKVIHNPVVEKVSDVVGGTVARPNAVLSGSVLATFLTLVLFLIAKQYGYRLSGFETIATFTLGWLLGTMYDYLRLMTSGKRRS